MPLDPIVMGLGAREGYSGGDLTNVSGAARRGEVHWLAAPDPTAVLELRIHGVGGAPPSDNLESPAVLQTAGDDDAGFFRAWYPGGSPAKLPRVEAYCWGGLNYRRKWSATWLLLLPFGLVNLAEWMLPDARNRVLANLARFVLRLLALTLTAAYVATSMYLFTDLLARQAAGRHRLWSWLHWYAQWDPQQRLAAASVPTFAVIALLTWLGVRSQGRYEETKAGFRAPNDPGVPLSTAAFWNGKHRLTHLRHAHLVACGAVVAYVEVSPEVDGYEGWRQAIMWGCVAAAGLAVLMVVFPWKVATSVPSQSKVGYIAGFMAGYGTVVLAVAVCVARWWWPTASCNAQVIGGGKDGPAEPCSLTAIPHDLALQNTLSLLPVGLAVLLSLVVLLHGPWRRGDVFALGFTAPVVSVLAAVVSSIFGACVLMTAGNILGDPSLPFNAKKIASAQANDFSMPFFVYAAGLAFVATLAAAVVLAVGLWTTRTVWACGLRKGTTPGTLAHVYAARGADVAGKSSASRKNTAVVWASSHLTDLAAVALLALVLPTAAVYVAYFVDLAEEDPPTWTNNLARLGTVAGILVTVTFLNFLRSAFTNTTARKRFGFFWDVVTFWPRACHPFGPPSYGERSVPEVVTRIRRIVGDKAGNQDDPAMAQQRAEQVPAGGPQLLEEHSPVLLVGYSQGAPIATAVMAQLPPDIRNQVALLTLASPARRLYGRAFPAYFGTAQLDLLHGWLSDPRGVRWRNVLRRSDYIGGWVRSNPDDANTARSDVDREIFDPPVLWGDADPAPPSTHLHSDWFPDPQTRPYADELRALVPAPAGPPASTRAMGEMPAWLVRHSHTHDHVTHAYYVAGPVDAPAILLMHEFPGIGEGLYDFAGKLAERYRVFIPSLLGRDGSPTLGNSVKQLCIQREIRLLFSRAPAVTWLRDFMDDVVASNDPQARLGVVGMCMTGNFALALAVDDRVRAAVVAQPALPVRPSSLGLSTAEHAALRERSNLCVRGFRFTNDFLSPKAKLDAADTLLRDAIIVEQLHPPAKGRHSTLTGLSADKKAVDTVLDFFAQRL